MSDIDPQEIGRLQSEVVALRRDNDRLMTVLEKVDTRLASIEKKLSEARGGWIVLVAVGAAVGSLIELAVSYLIGRGTP